MNLIGLKDSYVLAIGALQAHLLPHQLAGATTSGEACMSSNAISNASSADSQLRRNRLGVVGIVFFVVAAAAPLVGMTGAVPVAIVAGNGAGVPGAYLFVGITLLLFSVGYATMSGHVTNAGAFFAYVGRGLGMIPGVASAFVSLLAYLAVQLAIYGFFGVIMSGQMEQYGLSLHPYAWALIAWALVFALSWFSVDIGAKFLGVLMSVELLSLVVVALAVFFKGGGPNGLDFAASFSPSKVFTMAPGIALAFAFASFIGFEATAIYGEEARDPKRAVPRATYLSVTIITVLFAMVSFAIVSGLGSANIVDTVAKTTTVGDVVLGNPAQALWDVSDTFVGPWLTTTMQWLVISSLFAGLLAFQNSSARYFFSLGRAGVLPNSAARTNSFGSPATGSIITSVITAVVIGVFWLKKLDAFNAMFSWFSALSVLAIVFVEALVCIAVIRYFRRSESGDSRLWQTLIAPVLAFIGLCYGEYLLASKFGVLCPPVALNPAAPADWGYTTTGWSLVLSAVVVFVLGCVVAAGRRGAESEDAVRDLVS